MSASTPRKLSKYELEWLEYQKTLEEEQKKVQEEEEEVRNRSKRNARLNTTVNDMFVHISRCKSWCLIDKAVKS